VRTSLPLSDVAVWDNGAWRHLGGAIAGNNLQAVLRFKRGIAVGGPGVVIQPPAAPVTTTAPPLPPGLSTETTLPVAPDVGFSGSVPTTFFTAPPPPGAAVPAPVVAPVPIIGGPGNATVDIPLPDGIGADGVVFLRLVADASMGIAGDSVLSLVEVVK